jgi:AraC-like DNA-binding protein
MISVGLDIGVGSRHWLTEAKHGEVRIFWPGSELDVIQRGKFQHLWIVLSEDRLMEAEETEGLVIDRTVIQQCGLHPKMLAPEAIDAMKRWTDAARPGAIFDAENLARFRQRSLSTFINHFGRAPLDLTGVPSIGGKERIVGRARAFIDAHLDQPISLKEIAAATSASRRTMTRAFSSILDESPQSYLAHLRLNRIRSDLVRSRGASTIAEISNRWGVSELGRMAGRYKSLFGEAPSETVRSAKTMRLGPLLK